MKRKSIFYSLIFLFIISLTACASTKAEVIDKVEPVQSEKIVDTTIQTTEKEAKAKKAHAKKSSISLLFGGDIMAHNENYRVDDFSKIWKNVLNLTGENDLVFANIESPVDTTKNIASYPYFNMSKKYLSAAIDAGFNVFSLSNNHSGDQGLSGIQETEKTVEALKKEAEEKHKALYFSGLKNGPEANYTYNLIKKNDWTILFLPVTELLNLYENKNYINYTVNSKEGREKLIQYCEKLRKENPCDLFILSFHTSEDEYVREYTREQTDFYKKLLDAGVDILWANHAHIIKDRKIIINTKNNTQKIIMYGNGNTISGQRRAPVLSQKNPNGERDNTGDGILYKVIFTKDENHPNPVISFAKPYFITTYINTANHFILQKLDDEFIDYLYNVPRKDWAEYISRRKKINEDYTKDLIEWE